LPNLLNKIFIFTKLTTNYQDVCLPLLQDEKMSACLSLSYDVLVGVEFSCLNIVKDKVVNFDHPRENRVLLDRFQEEVFLDLSF
jgi:deoxycytidine triphosphate deaminase